MGALYSGSTPSRGARCGLTPRHSPVRGSAASRRLAADRASVPPGGRRHADRRFRHRPPPRYRLHDTTGGERLALIETCATKAASRESLVVVPATESATDVAVWPSEVHGAVALSPEPHRTKNLDPRRLQFGLRLLNVVDEELGHGAGRHMRLRLQARPPQLDLIPIRKLEPNEVVRFSASGNPITSVKKAAITSVSVVRTPRNTSPCAFTRSSSSGCTQPNDDTAVTVNEEAVDAISRGTPDSRSRVSSEHTGGLAVFSLIYRWYCGNALEAFDRGFRASGVFTYIRTCDWYRDRPKVAQTEEWATTAARPRGALRSSRSTKAWSTVTSRSSAEPQPSRLPGKREAAP